MERSIACWQWKDGRNDFGNVENERIQLNEESLWAGNHIDVTTPVRQAT
ncbi:MAG: hypothetical protein WDM90_22105 [Ferruginibacter sp.]